VRAMNFSIPSVWRWNNRSRVRSHTTYCGYVKLLQCSLIFRYTVVEDGGGCCIPSFGSQNARDCIVS